MRLARTALLTTGVMLSSALAMAQPQPAPPAPAQPAPAPPPAAAAQPTPAPAAAAPAQPAVDAQPAPDAAPRADAPPQPPPPGSKTAAPEPPAAAPKAFPMEPEVMGGATASGPPLAGWHGNFFLRDPNDYFRLYPRGRFHLDFHSFFGPGVNGKDEGVAAVDGGNGLKNRLFVRRLRLELAGEIMKRIQWTVQVEFGGMPLSNSDGKTQTSASSVGKEPTADSARWAAVEAPSASASVADAYINYSVCPCLNFQIGQFNGPLTMENKTSNNSLPFIERNLPVRSFVMPTNKEIGLMVWGELGEKNLMYEVGVFAGDGQNRGQVDNAVDVMGRVFARPFAKKGGKGLLEKAHIGVSARHGERDHSFVGYSYPGITTGQGVTLWNPRYTDSSTKRVHIIPSGAQNIIGGELRLPISIAELRGEAYYVANNTREALDGYQVTNTERFGQVTGLGWYVQLSAWPLGDSFVNGDPGFQRPTKVDLSKDPGKPKKGLEVLAIIGGVSANYDGANRLDSKYDEKTPGAEGVTSRIAVMQYGVGANYWYSKYFRASVNYMVYQTPGSGAEKDNLASVPGNTSKVEEIRDNARVIHELGTRFGVVF